MRLQSGEQSSFSGSLDNLYQCDISPLLAGWLVPQNQEATGEYPRVDLRVDLGAECRAERGSVDTSWTIGAGTNVTLSSTWSAALSALYSGGVKDTGSWYNGLLLELTLAIDF
jgi:opacity protein-like surface antigen